MSDRFASARAVADAVLYEGYVLYPYRASAAKNQARWQWGVLTPPAYRDERCGVATDCLLEAGPAAAVTVQVRFLQLQRRRVEEAVPGGHWRTVDRLEVDGRDHVTWDEAIERTVELRLRIGTPREERFGFSGGEEASVLAGGVGRVRTTRWPVEGRVSVEARRSGGPVGPVVLHVALDNTTAWEGEGGGRQEAMTRSLLAAHAVLAVDGGRWLSTLDPPAWATHAATQCRSDGWYPVLVDDLVLATPIILYDQPQVAPTSPGDMCDATEIDEILALRVLTLTDAEKAEARATDSRAAAIVDRCDGLSPDAWGRLHGEVRPVAAAAAPTAAGNAGSAPWWDPGVDGAVDPERDAVLVGGEAVRAGSAVLLRPSHRADIHDLFLDGMHATVAGVWQTVDGDVQVAVTVDDDPATEALAWQGRYLYFHPDELEVAR